MQLDAKAIAEATAAVVRKEVGAAVEPLVRRLAELEARPAPERGERGAAGEPGRCGVGLAGGIINRAGVLVLTLSDGDTREIGMVVGKDGADGADGKDGAPGERGERGEPGEPGPVGERGEPGPVGEKGLDGKDGAPGERGEPGESGERGEPGPVGDKGLDGKDGRDGAPGEKGKDGHAGFELEDFDVRVLDDDRTVELSLKAGEHQNIATLKWPTMIYRGVFRAGETYQRGDVSTWGGSLWHCDEETIAKPGEGPWTLAAKKGRDGKDAK